MAAKTLKSVQFLAIFVVFVLIASSEMMRGVEANLCEKASQTWTGDCKPNQTGRCDNQCKSWEHASHGACHKRGSWKCFCYFNCKKNSTTTDQKV
ncbi:hypothetical protein ACOSP7_005622 [Xanthoceras sorbifolium]|uniref:Knottins-like domain-containing protein n=1 Tax=Xanthoceras sorbifolium TaxID=99658 RepID=A0ABQ8IEG4_9ROSI|nr:hypothetical protein JRO89_XS02G0041700 [Xanthoceras sorbifolium]